MKTNPFGEETLALIVKDRQIRRAVAQDSHVMFFHIYFSHYIAYPLADFHREIFSITDDVTNKLAIILAFRGSGKSTLISFSYALWSILGIQEKRFVLIISKTQAQAKQIMANLRRELESNALLRSDLGPFQEESGEWGASSLVFTALGARITAVSSETSIRGLRHNQYRPDLIICDDVEDLASTRTHELRQKTYNWLTSEVIPAGDRSTRLIVIGNLLHRESLVMRLKKDIDEGARDGVFKMYPLVSEDGKRLWPGKYPDEASIEEERKKSGNEFAFQREYLLNVIADEDQAIEESWIHYYDELPSKGKFRQLFMGVDLAISLAETADYTAIVSGVLVGYGESLCLYILPNVVHKRMRFPEQVEQIRQSYLANRATFSSVYPLIEKNGYQEAIIHQLVGVGIRAVPIQTVTDKRSRLVTLSGMLKNGQIKFPRAGCEDVIREIVDYGIEPHDDLMDAFTLVGQRVLEKFKPAPFVTSFEVSSPKPAADNFDWLTGTRGWTEIYRG